MEQVWLDEAQIEHLYCDIIATHQLREGATYPTDSGNAAQLWCSCDGWRTEYQMPDHHERSRSVVHHNEHVRPLLRNALTSAQIDHTAAVFKHYLKGHLPRDLPLADGSYRPACSCGCWISDDSRWERYHDHLSSVLAQFIGPQLADQIQ